MTQDHELIDRVRRALARLPDVDEKNMFGSMAFIVQDKLCVSARAERIMCRIDPALHDEALEHEGCHTVVMKGQERLGYVYIDAEFVRTEASLAYWIDLALNYNKTIAQTATQN